jgi:lipopolysaccharide transport system permease protein
MLLVLYIYHLAAAFPVYPSRFMFLFPLLIIWLASIGAGAGIIVSSLTTKYRDLKQLVSFALHLAMYATPVVYPISEIPERFRWIAYVNPVCAPLELFRLWFFGAASVNGVMIVSSLCAAAALSFFGLILFNQNEQNFIDVV